MRPFVICVALGLFAAPAWAQDVVLPRTQELVPRSREQVTLTFAPIVKKAGPSVVNIFTKRVIKQRPSPFANDPFFRRFFGEDFAQQFGGQSSERIQNSLGSGVIVRSNGIILTNNHVIEGADQITVVLSDRREFEATVVGRDDRTDLAVLRMKIEGESLPALDLANSDGLEVGDLVLAIGNPFGVGQTVTSGIVSALARTSVAAADVRSFIQTDAAINPGNSGGALITSDGRLVGINSAIYSQSGGSIGIGFAIPANLARNVLTSILSGGKVVRPWLGASGQSVNADLARNLGLPRPGGVVVERVQPKSPAARAGLAVGDVILSLDGKDVVDSDELRYQLVTLPMGATPKLEVNRAGVKKTLNLHLEAPPEDPPRQKTTLAGRHPYAGAVVANLNPALADELKLDYEEPNVIVLEVGGNSVAARLGVRPGDKLLDINGVTFTTVDELQEELAKPATAWKITLNRGGQILQSTIGN